MNQSQLKYARERATKIKNEKRAAIQTAFHVKPFTDKEKVKAIRDGAFTIKKPKIGTRIYFVADVISFDGETKKDEKGLKAALEKLESDFQKLMDEMVLGDNEAALAMLRAFEQAAA